MQSWRKASPTGGQRHPPLYFPYLGLPGCRHLARLSQLDLCILHFVPLGLQVVHSAGQLHLLVLCDARRRYLRREVPYEKYLTKKIRRRR
jgi:hypothetical protein